MSGTPGGVRPATYERNRRALERFHTGAATIERRQLGPEPLPGYTGGAQWVEVAVLACAFPVPIPGSVLGHVPGETIDIIQRRYGMTVAHDADVLEGDRVVRVIDALGRQLNVRPMKVDAVVLRSTHALVVLEEYGVT